MKLRDEHTRLLNDVKELLPKMHAEATYLDENAQFPHASFDHLIKIHLLIATLPVSEGGLGFGYGADGAEALLRLFLLLGEASLSVARLYEAHVNALQLIHRYGSKTLIERSASDATQNHIFALWVTDPIEGGVCLDSSGKNLVLNGGKAFCSGAGVATRALITAKTETGIQMLVVKLETYTRVIPSNIKLSGMRAAVTGSVDLSGLHIAYDDLLGQEGDYLREPVFSAGAWRSAAAALGGLAALVKLHRLEILKRHRENDPHQRARFGQMVMLYESARLWMVNASRLGCLEDDTDDAIVAYINLARLAVEAACLDAMRFAQRSLGLAAFMAGHSTERLCRDLATYLRQPAPDETLDKAAMFYFESGLPEEI